MRKVRNITVAVPHDLYLQSRRLAAEYDTTVTAIVAHILERMPAYLKSSDYPVGGPKRTVLGPKDIARETPSRPASAPPQRKSAFFTTPAAVAPSTFAESAISAIPLDFITAAVRQYDGAINPESFT